jgi:signal transduction histidine kinase/CheY-like chemotaxis protein/HPt (histidine-containing phosphotransfer) domain-containing protein
VKKIWLLVKIGFLMILAVTLLAATGYLSYRNISSIVSSIHLEVKPDQRLMIIREILMDLEKAENSIRIYSVTNDTRDIQPYYKIISNIDAKVTRFREECKNDTLLLQKTDTISRLIEENIINWNELLYLIHNDRVIDYLKQMSDQLTSNAEDVRTSEKGILSRVFSRSRKKTLNEEVLITNLKEIGKQDSIEKEKLMTRESQLTKTDIEIKNQFYRLITSMENEVTGLINQKASEADALAEETYKWLALFSLSGTLLALLVMIIVIRYVRKTHAYQKALENSKAETERLTRTKEQFMANISHEIRTPVTAISGFTEQLLHDQLDESTVKTLKIIKSSSDHLGRMMNNILDFSKLQNGKLILEKEHFNIRQLFEDVYALFENQALQKNNTLSYSVTPETPEVLLGDPFRLKQIMINLIGNSVKFTSNGKIHFSGKGIITQFPGMELAMEFVDTGIGIEESKLNFVFEDFMQEEMSTTRKYGGTGLGLSIVKKLVELHKGTIDIKSKKNHGTSISCRLPYLAGETEKIRRELKLPLEIPQELRELKILIVDDEEYNRLLLKKIFARWMIECREAVNGMDALEQLKDEQFDLLLMDMRMPGIDGLKATRYIREEMNIKPSEMPVICFSAVSMKTEKEDMDRAGINAYLQKPFTEDMLLSVILSVIKIRKSALTNKNKGEVIKNQYTAGKINLENLLHLSEGDNQFTRQMLSTFLETTNKGLVEMIDALQSGNYETVAGLAHKILPPCRHIGAVDLSNLLKKIEETARFESGHEILENLIMASKSEFKAVSEQIRAEVAKIR